MAAEQTNLLISPDFVFYRNPTEHPNTKKQISKDADWGLIPLGYTYSNGSLMRLGWGSVWLKPESEVGIIILPNYKRYSGRMTLFSRNNNSWVDSDKGITRFTGLSGMHFPGVAIESAPYKNKNEFISLLSNYDDKATNCYDEMLVYAHFLLAAMKEIRQQSLVS